MSDITFEQDVNYMLANVLERKDELKRRRKLLLQNKDRNEEIITSVATVNKNRVVINRDFELCSLFEELLMYLGNKQEIMLSEDAVKGYEKLCEPKERELL